MGDDVVNKRIVQVQEDSVAMRCDAMFVDVLMSGAGDG